MCFADEFDKFDAQKNEFAKLVKDIGLFSLLSFGQYVLHLVYSSLRNQAPEGASLKFMHESVVQEEFKPGT